MSSSTETGSETIPKGLNDRASPEDSLNFSPYVTALEQFLLHADPPLTVSIEGRWGSGKSSFMRQLMRRLKDRKYVTVEFNPWRHQAEDALWAAFILAFIDQISDRLTVWKRLRARMKLLEIRSRKHRNRTFAWSGVTVFCSLLVGVVTFSVFGGDAPSTLALLEESLPQEPLGEPFQTILPPVVGTTVSVFAFVLWMRQNVVERMRREVQSYQTNAAYEDRVSFIERFHEDFGHLLDAYVGKDRPVFVFIDDLDRCEVSKVADIMESIHLMLSEDSRLVFLIGMDREKVAGALAAKHSELLKHLYGEEDHASGLEYGNQYIEKFIQIPFDVPQITTMNINEFVETVTAEPKMSTTKGNQSNSKKKHLGYRGKKSLRERFRRPSSEPPQSLSVTVPGWSQELLQRVTRIVAPILDHNPRQLKRFVNLYTLTALVIKERRLIRRVRPTLDRSMEEPQPRSDTDPTGPTLEQIGKFVAIPLRWPHLHLEVQRNPKLLVDLTLVALQRRYWRPYYEAQSKRGRDDANESDDTHESGNDRLNLTARDKDTKDRVDDLTESSPDDVSALLQLVLAGLYGDDRKTGKSAERRKAEFEELRLEFQGEFNEYDAKKFFRTVGPTRILQVTGADQTYSLANESVVRTLLEASPRSASMGKEQYQEILRYRRDIDQNPRAAWIRVNFANLLYDLEQMNEAEEQYLEALKIDEDDAEAHYGYARLLIDQMRLDEIEEENLKKALEYSDEWWIRANYAEFLSKQGREAEADKQWNRLDRTGMRVRSAEFLSEQGREDKADERYQAALERDPDDTWIRCDYAEFLREQGRHDEADEQYRAALESLREGRETLHVTAYPPGVRVRTSYAEFLSEQGREDEANEQYRVALKLEPDHPDIRVSYAEFLSEQGRENEADKQYRAALIHEPQLADIRASYANFLRKRGREDEADEIYLDN